MPRVVLVRPIYQLNVGLIARAVKNFGWSELVLVKPKARKGFKARMFAKHSEEVIKNARVVASLGEAVEGCDVVVGTTGTVNRFRKKLKNCVTIEEAAEKTSGRNVALVFGSERDGLGEEDMAACDLVAHIPTKAPHPILNMSHAVAIALYEYNKGREKLFDEAPPFKRRRLEEMFAEIVSGLETVKDKQKVSAAFRRVLERGNIADDEAQALFAAFSGIRKQRKSARAERK